MPNTPERDVVKEARALLSKGTPRPWIVVDKGEYDPKRGRELLAFLCDEVERLKLRILELETEIDTKAGYL